MATSIWDLKANPWSNEPRFYPPGGHPAFARMRQELARMEQAGFGDHEHAVYLRDRLAELEERESDVKALMDVSLR